MGKGTATLLLIAGVLLLAIGGWNLMGTVNSDDGSCGSVMSPSNPSAEASDPMTERIMDNGSEISCDRLRSGRQETGYVFAAIGAAVLIAGGIGINKATTADGTRQTFEDPL